MHSFDLGPDSKDPGLVACLREQKSQHTFAKNIAEQLAPNSSSHPSEERFPSLCLAAFILEASSMLGEAILELSG